MNTDGRKASQKVSFKTYFLNCMKRMRIAYDICQPSDELGEEESALTQCFMAIAGFKRKMMRCSFRTPPADAKPPKDIKHAEAPPR